MQKNAFEKFNTMPSYGTLKDDYNYYILVYDIELEAKEGSKLPTANELGSRISMELYKQDSEVIVSNAQISNLCFLDEKTNEIIDEKTNKIEVNKKYTYVSILQIPKKYQNYNLSIHCKALNIEPVYIEGDGIHWGYWTQRDTKDFDLQEMIDYFNK